MKIISENEEGIINFINFSKGYGFIRRQKGKDVFFLLVDFNNQNIQEGMSLNFEIHEITHNNKKHRIAKNMKII